MQVTLFFTYGVGLTTWQKRGLFSREVGYYRALTKHGVDRVVFVSYDPSDIVFRSDLERDNIFLCTRPVWIPKILYSCINPLIHWSIMKHTTIFKTNQMSGSWSGVIAKIIWRKPLIVRTGYSWSETKRRQNKQSAFVVTRIVEWVCTSFANYTIISTVSQQNIIPKSFQKKLAVIPNYIDTQLFSPIVSPVGQESVLDQCRILSVGRLAPEKNWTFLFNVLALLPIHVTLVIVGDGEMRTELEQKAAQLGVSVQFVGMVPNQDLPIWFAHADMFVLPSKFEGNPKALLEAMSCAVPVVAGCVPGVIDIVQHNVTGFLARLDVKQFAGMIQYVYEHKSASKVVGEQARQWVVKHQSLESVIEKEFLLYSNYI